jgi:integrase
MLKLGVNPKIAQRRLGHSNFSTTMDTYSHIIDDMGQEAAETLNTGLLFSPNEEVH